VLDAADVVLVGTETFHPCCLSCWVKWPAAFGSCVPLATRTFTLEWATVEVVVERGRVEVGVVGDVDVDLRWGPTTEPTYPARASAVRQTKATPMLLPQDDR